MSKSLGNYDKIPQRQGDNHVSKKLDKPFVKGPTEPNPDNRLKGCICQQYDPDTRGQSQRDMSPVI